MFFVFVFLLSWIVFLFLFHKDSFKEFYPSALLGMIMSLTSDIVTHFYPFWKYSDPYTHLNPMIIELLDDFGLYPVMAYLYAQFVPSTFKKWFYYTFLWTTGGVITETVIKYKGFIHYDLGWTLLYSVIADWIIFCILSLHHIWYLKHRRRVMVATSLGKAFICFEQNIVPLIPTHPLSKIPTYGVQFYQSASTENVESFLFILEPDAVIPLHSHEGYEMHYVIEGSIAVVLNGREVELKQGQPFHFPSTIPHSFRNLGTKPAKIISFLTVHENACQAIN